MCAILPDDAPLPDEPQVRFVDERGRLKSVVRPLAAEIGSRAPPQFLVNQGYQLVARVEVALAPRSQQVSDRAGLRGAVSASR